MSYLGENLIFIISQPKAGSTLLQRILAGHPDIQTSAETWLMLHPAYGLRRKGIKTDYNARWASTGVREFLDHYADGRDTYLDGIRSFAESVYGRVLDKHGKKLFLDKTPRYTMIIDELIELFPNAKYVLLIRNPLAILKSEIHTYIGDNWPQLAKFGPDLLDAPRRLVAARDSLGDAGFEIRYEDLVSEPERNVRALCDFLGISFSPDMLDYSGTPPPVGRMNDPVGVHRHTAPSTESLARWKELAGDRQLRHFALSYLDDIGTSTLARLGYDTAQLRAEIEGGSVTTPTSPIYPWKLAMRPESRWGLRDHMYSTYVLAAQKHGHVRAVTDVLGLMFRRARGGFRRLVGGK
jgi:hypothetical protein